MVHEHGGQVYLDGANLNAQVCEKHWYLMVKISFTKLPCEDFTVKKTVFFSRNHFPSHLMDNLSSLSPELPERRLKELCHALVMLRSFFKFVVCNQC